ncbi:DsrE/DsrF/TusD sulfur relay family protein [Idiomarina xiamenensis]|uniref:Uncharacterized protein n=1 Tax=Idiomarina xiamenensis 10-D-4 TaxID=740709 RepID=K2JZ13_9GAMM|nr:DsrE family protein [Idiomarina xiamenensis]EKE79852.1 hypothetical protein A10D4_12637 [Idiomarina xiamenensis 10-D-4]
MATITLLLQAAPHQSYRSAQALRYAKAAHAAGHQILQVFFYGDGVFHAHSQRQPVASAQADDIVSAWQQWSAASQVPLQVCETLLEDFGVDGKVAGFSAHGLLSFAEAASRSDRCIQF